MKILFKYASRSRPENFFRGLKSIAENCADNNHTILITLDDEDESMNNQKIKSRLGVYKNTVIDWGYSRGKIDAINRGLHLVKEWDILVNMSDDMVFTEKGFDNILRSDFNKYFPDLDGCLHYNDGNQKDKVCSMSIIGRKYFNRYSYIYYPMYKSMFADDDFLFCASQQGRIKYMGDNKIIFRHLHPSFSHSDSDKQYLDQSTPEVWQHDIDIFELRKKVNFKL